MLAAATLELLAIFAPGSTFAEGALPAALDGGWLRGTRIALPGILVLGTLLCRAFARGEKDTRLRAFFSRGGTGRQILLFSWILAVSLAEELQGRPPFLLVIGLAAAALYAWRRPLLLATCAAAGAALVVVADLLLRGDLDVERLILAVSAAALSVASGATIRYAVLRSSDRLSSLERENRKLWELSFRDGLTGLFNRRYSQEIGAMLFARARRYNEQLHVLMLDIDRFKLVNDKLGHPVGDEVLNGIAEILVSQVRASDVVTRYGGEEFLIFLIQTEPEVVQFIANRIRDSVAAHAFSGVPWQITISIGVAGIKVDDSLEELVDRADKYLYASKRGGRNRVTGF
jgi:diguanylate cyclase (GGDEF)-like protein